MRRGARMSSTQREETVPAGFDNPTILPSDDRQAQAWQEANRLWWETHPMRYDWKESVGYDEFSLRFYQEIDARFFSAAAQFMPVRQRPFDALIDFEGLKTRDVLEIGVGNGSHAQLLAAHAGTFTGIDLTDYAVRSTARRLELANLPATIRRMDAERMDFPDNSFDFIWSWGVIHHSSNTAGVLKEMHRVLRPGGTAVTMVYHRSAWAYYVITGLFHGIIRGGLFRHGSLHEVLQRTTDGAIARYYTIPEWRELVGRHFEVLETRVYGSKAEIVPLPGGKLKRLVMSAFPDACARFLTNNLGWGNFLVSRFRKR